MTNTSTLPLPLPRPEDRCRGDLERWVGCRGAELNWRSEGFAEDVLLPPATVGATPPPSEPGQPIPWRWVRPLLWTHSPGLARG